MSSDEFRQSGSDFQPNPSTGGISLFSEACVVISESEARILVTAIENCRSSDVFAVLKRQPWFGNIRAGVRATRHLDPDAYLHLSGHVRRSHRIDAIGGTGCKATVETQV